MVSAAPDNPLGFFLFLGGLFLRGQHRRKHIPGVAPKAPLIGGEKSTSAVIIGENIPTKSV
jgi:hypothetical protein